MKIKRIQFVKFFLGIVLFCIIISQFVDLKNLKRIFEFGILNLVIICLFTYLINCTSTYRWIIILRSIGIQNLSFRFLLKTTFISRISGHFISQIIGDIGVRSFILKEQKIEFKRSIFSIICDKSFEVLMMISVFFGNICYILFSIEESLIFIMAIILLFLLFFFINHIGNILVRFKPIKDKMLHINFTLSQKLIICILTFLKYIFVTVRYFFIFSILHIGLNFYQTFAGTSVAQIGNLIGVTPGGLGVVEAGWAGVLSFYQMEPDRIGLFLFSQRVIILLSILILCGVIYLTDKLFNSIRGI